MRYFYFLNLIFGNKIEYNKKKSTNLEKKTKISYENFFIFIYFYIKFFLNTENFSIKKFFKTFFFFIIWNWIYFKKFKNFLQKRIKNLRMKNQILSKFFDFSVCFENKLNFLKLWNQELFQSKNKNFFLHRIKFSDLILMKNENSKFFFDNEQFLGLKNFPSSELKAFQFNNCYEFIKNYFFKLEKKSFDYKFFFLEITLFFIKVHVMYRYGKYIYRILYDYFFRKSNKKRLNFQKEILKVILQKNFKFPFRGSILNKNKLIQEDLWRQRKYFKKNKKFFIRINF
jgi:hypothetical protein